MLNLAFDYADCIRSSEKVCWKLDDVMPTSTRLDFSRPFLPQALARPDGLDFLDDKSLLRLNQITGNAYVNLFAFVEEYILSMAVSHAQAEMFGDHDTIRALVRFADEEIKHQQLFWRYLAAFKRDFGHDCEVLGEAGAVAHVILSKSPIAVVLTTLHIEIMTQQHYTDSVRDDRNLDPLFSSLLKFHWLEEAQHARIDALELDRLVADATPDAIATAITDYLDILTAFDGLLTQQGEMDARSLANALGREFSDGERARLAASQHAVYRRTFLISGMTNKLFMQYVAALSPDGAARVAARVEALR